MNFDLFRALVCVSSPEQIQQASQILYTNLENPELAQFILQTYFSSDVQNDEMLMTSMCFVMYEIIKCLWKNRPENYDINTFNAIRQQVIMMALNSPPNSQKSLLDAIHYIIYAEDASAEDIFNLSLQIFQKQDNLKTLYISFSIFKSWAAVASRKQLDKVDRYTPFLQIYSQIFDDFKSKNQVSNDTFNIYQIAAVTFHKLVKKDFIDFLKNDKFAVFCHFFMQCLVIQNDEINCLQMKKEIMDLFSELIRTDAQFFQIFSQQIVPMIPSIYSTIVDKKINTPVSSLLEVIYALMFNGCDAFYNSEFVNNVLVHSSRLSNSDIEQMTDSPEVYFEQNLENLDTNIDFFSPREISGKIIFLFIKNKQESLFSFNMSNPNLFDLEAYIYLISSGYNQLGDLEDAIMNPQLYSSLLNLSKSQPHDSFLLPTIIYALQNKIIEEVPDLLQEVSSLAYNLTMNSQNPIIIIVSLRLLRSTIILLCEFEMFDSLINVPELLQRLLILSHNIHSKEIGSIIKLISQEKPDSILPFSVGLYKELLNTWLMISSQLDAQNEEQNEEAIEIIHSAALMIDIQKDENVIVELSEIGAKFAIQAITEYNNTDSINDVKGLFCTKLCQKIGHPTESIINLVVFACQKILSDKMEVYALKEYSGIFITLMPSLSQEMVHEIIGICYHILNDPNTEETISACALIILADIILIHGKLDLAQIAIKIMQQDIYSILLTGCVYVLTAALHATNAQFAPQIPSDVIEKWILSSNIDTFPTKRDIHTASIGLLLLAKAGNIEAFKAAYNLLLSSFEKDTILEEEDNDEENEIVYSDVTISTDFLSHSALFLEIAKQLDALGSLDQNFVSFLSQNQ